MSRPAASDAIQFLTNLQTLLTDGLFTATYKHALLLSLADLSVETLGDQTVLIIDTHTLAEKFIHYYWRQTVPYTTPTLPQGRTLSQNTNPEKEAAIFSVIKELRRVSDGTITGAIGNKFAWRRAVAKVARLIEIMPLWKLQIVGGKELCFLYENKWHENRKGIIALYPGVSSHFRRFYPLIQSLIRDAWIRHIRKLDANQNILGQNTDLYEFLFGSERQDLTFLIPILAPLQGGTCFYCGIRITGRADIDHFIPWSRYSVDLAHNFVLAHSTCNGNKSNYLPAIPHLSNWLQRNVQCNSVLEEAFAKQRIPYNLIASVHIASWAYEQAEQSGASLWVSKKTFCAVDSNWRTLFS